VLGKGAWWRIVVVAMLVIGPSGVTAVHGQQPQKPAADEFLPIDQLPPGEQLPAAPLLIAAYSVVWLLVAGYLFSIWKRLGRVEREIAEVSRRLPQGRT
jgi:CcmD family protein